MLNFFKSFSTSIEIMMCFLFFVLIIWCINLIDLCMLGCCACLPGINPTWSGFMSLLMCYWDQFTSILLMIFASVFIKDVVRCSYTIFGFHIGKSESESEVAQSCPTFCHRWPHKMDLKVFFLFVFSLKIGINSSLSGW